MGDVKYTDVMLGIGLVVILVIGLGLLLGAL